MLKRLKTLVEQHSYECKNKICIITDDKQNGILNKIHEEYNAPILKLTDDIDPFCLILIKYKNSNGLLSNFIEEQIEKSKKVILIVDKEFDFSNLVKKSKANSIDAIILKDSGDYIIVMSQ